MPLLARPKILVFAGSVRSGALSQKVADIAAKEIALLDAEVTKISLIDYPLPIYNGDLEKEKGIPENALKLGRLLAAHQGVFVSTPEYNNSVPPLLKNTIDWVSRIRPDRDIRDDYVGELYRCIAGSWLQVTIANYEGGDFNFDGGETLTCRAGEALYHGAGGLLECRPQTPERRQSSPGP